MPEISVIVPVYNTEKYLRRCVDSILAQTFTDFELILVDDGSTDNSGKICDEYAERDKRVRVFHQENAGASSARNIGIDFSKGKYVVFCDSDDCVSDKYLEHMIECIRDEYSVVLPMCSFCNSIEELGKCDTPRIWLEKMQTASLYNMGKGGYIWGCIFFKSIIDNKKIRFRVLDDKNDYNEDLIFFIQYISEIDRFCCYGYKDYAYIVRKNSLSNKFSLYSYDKWKEKYILKRELLSMDPDVSTSDYSRLGREFIYETQNVLKNIVADGKSNRKIKKQVFKNVVISDELKVGLQEADLSEENTKIIKLLRNRCFTSLWIFYSLTLLKQKLKKRSHNK